MKSEYKFFAVITGFLVLACGVYAWWTAYESPTGEIEWIGVVALALSSLLCIMCGGYFWFVSRRIDPRPEDRDEGEIADGAGEIGFFSPGSYYPFGLALAAVVAGLGLVYLLWWLIAVGVIAVLIAAGGLLFEYYTGARKAH
jgi:membrane protein implicated in regulation of membrane protease activity